MKHIEIDYWTGIKETYLRVNKKEAFKWITIEGIGQRASMDEVCHKLSYMGRILENPVENTWKIEDGEDDYLKDIKNGDISVKMKLDFEVNYLITGMTAYMVNYQGQAKQCGFCFSWKHSKVSECPRRNQGAGRKELLRNYYESWKKEVGYKKRLDLDVTANEPRKNIGEKEKDEEEDETGLEKDFLEYEKDEEDEVEKDGGDEEKDGEVEVMSENEKEKESGKGSENEIDGEDKWTEMEDEYDSVGNLEDQEEEDEDVREEVDEVGDGHCEGEDADDDDEDGEEEKSSCAGATTIDFVEVTDGVSNVGVNDEDVTVEKDYGEGVQRMEMDQQEIKEGSGLDRAGIG